MNAAQLGGFHKEEGASDSGPGKGRKVSDCPSRGNRPDKAKGIQATSQLHPGRSRSAELLKVRGQNGKQVTQFVIRKSSIKNTWEKPRAQAIIP